MFVVLTPDFNILENLSPLSTATEQISELLTECVLKGEVNMDLQEQLVQCLRILMFERRSRAANGDDHERKAHWSRGSGVNITLCFQLVQTCTQQSCVVHW